MNDFKGKRLLVLSGTAPHVSIIALDLKLMAPIRTIQSKVFQDQFS